ncbi:response regulator [Novosphingobium flavum]|uniref:histidine kinase n=1 Tax=Novosphingobium flavum TaxID=1778672 RepID=A0A7X1FR90_9SPHN|nr:response regulator [Novosphingobium flavum]MBC2665349.1 response regulator [Novosphingobium flavum]
MGAKDFARSSAESSAEFPVVPARILLVDDDERNLLALSHVVKDIAEVVTAASGREALRHLLLGEFAVVLLDVFMPGMDGYEVAQLIRERKQTARIPIIFLSAVNKETEHMMRGYAMGAVDYVFKPVDPVVLASKVSVFVDLYNMRQRIEAKSRAEQALREESFRAQLERLQIESELSASRARQAAIVAALPLALFEAVPGENGMLVREFIAGDLARLAGVDAPALEAGTLRWEDRICVDDLLALSSAAEAYADEVISNEYRWIGSDDSLRHFIEHCVPIACQDDGGVRWAGTMFDITDRKKLEAQLVQAGKMEVLGQLTGGIAHDFNNVLAAVLGGVRLLERKVGLDENGQRLIAQMRIAAEKGADLVRRMMAFARKQDLVPVRVSPAELCETVSGLVEQTLGAAITLEWECACDDLAFFADRSQLELALVNLVINARDAMPDGGKIEITTRPASPDEAAERSMAEGAAFLCIEVRDDGIGIPAALINRITEPFYTTKPLGKGTGLGLSMVMGFIQQSGGAIDISSEEGAGTVVRIFLPAVRHGRADKASIMPETERGKQVVRRVLVVDDEPTVRSIVAEQLRALGAEVVEASNGAEALECIAEPNFTIDMVISDYAMPGLNGLQTIERARHLRPDLRFVLMTGYSNNAPSTSDRTIPVLQKPVSEAEFDALLRERD